MYGTAAQITVDAVILLGAVLAALIGVKRGLFRSVMSIVVMAVALVIAVKTAGLLSGPVSDWLYPRLEAHFTAGEAAEDPSAESTEAVPGEGSVTEVPADEAGDAAAEAAGEESPTLSDEDRVLLPEEILEALDPEANPAVKEWLDRFGISGEEAQSLLLSLSASFSGDLELLTEDPEAFAKEFIAHSAKQILQLIVKTVITVVLFLLLWVVLSLLIRGLNQLLFELPVIGTLNRVGGAVFSIASWVLLICLVLYLCECLDVGFFEEQAPGTLLLKHLARYNPLGKWSS